MGDPGPSEAQAPRRPRATLPRLYKAARLYPHGVNEPKAYAALCDALGQINANILCNRAANPVAFHYTFPCGPNPPHGVGPQDEARLVEYVAQSEFTLKPNLPRLFGMIARSMGGQYAGSVLRAHFLNMVKTGRVSAMKWTTSARGWSKMVFPATAEAWATMRLQAPGADSVPALASTDDDMSVSESEEVVYLSDDDVIDLTAECPDERPPAVPGVVYTIDVSYYQRLGIDAPVHIPAESPDAQRRDMAAGKMMRIDDPSVVSHYLPILHAYEGDPSPRMVTLERLVANEPLTPNFLAYHYMDDSHTPSLVPFSSACPLRCVSAAEVEKRAEKKRETTQERAAIAHFLRRFQAVQEKFPGWTIWGVDTSIVPGVQERVDVTIMATLPDKTVCALHIELDFTRKDVKGEERTRLVKLVSKAGVPETVIFRLGLKPALGSHKPACVRQLPALRENEGMFETTDEADRRFDILFMAMGKLRDDMAQGRVPGRESRPYIKTAAPEKMCMCTTFGFFYGRD